MSFYVFTRFMSRISHAFNEYKVAHFSLISIVVKVYCVIFFLQLILETEILNFCSPLTKILPLNSVKKLHFFVVIIHALHL